MQRETALQLAIDMWGCLIDGHVTFPFRTIHSFLDGAYVCIEAPDLPLSHIIDLNRSEDNKCNESVNVDELLLIINTIAKAQVLSEFNITIYNDISFQAAPAPPNIVFVEVGLPRPSNAQIERYRQVCGDEDETNFRIIADNWNTGYANFFSNEDELQSIISQIRSSLKIVGNDRIDRHKALLGAYFLDLKASGFDIPNSLPSLISNHIDLWFNDNHKGVLRSSNIFLGLFPMSSLNPSYDLIDLIISRLFSKLQIRRNSVKTSDAEEDAAPPVLDRIKKNKINHEVIMMLLRLLYWIPADLRTLPQFPSLHEVEDFKNGYTVGPTHLNFKLEWDKRPGAGWNYAATQAFIHSFMKESQAYTSTLISQLDLQKQFARCFSYLRTKRKEALIIRDGGDLERTSLKEGRTKKLKQRRRANRRKGLFEHRLAVVSATPEWPPTVSRALALLGSDGTSSDETDSDVSNIAGRKAKYRRIPKLFRSSLINELIQVVDARGTEISKGRRTAQPFRQRTGNHLHDVNTIIPNNLPENFYNRTWLSKHRPDAMSLLHTGLYHAIPHLPFNGGECL